MVVREARAGAPVGEPIVVENVTGCPLEAERGGRSGPRDVFGGLTDRHYADVLRSFVEG
ncbi:hypothetical protein FHX44_113685 [Pseudonocardia hierapolitana]|uniref:Uncharacterized protein n=1 Tax=Pseudonocardia hierapolitana TaxID=1128676 RepID=A0A561SSC9_9PSEU|nr:hypothetical protein FHX44_113685 [Pseudonocardia hierapolitana]